MLEVHGLEPLPQCVLASDGQAFNTEPPVSRAHAVVGVTLWLSPSPC
jgi:hypothetical protein